MPPAVTTLLSRGSTSFYSSLSLPKCSSTFKKLHFQIVGNFFPHILFILYKILIESNKRNWDEYLCQKLDLIAYI